MRRERFAGDGSVQPVPGESMPTRSHPALTRAHERLREELEDDGIVLPGGPEQVDVLLTELDYARRPPVHEGRTPIYGSFVMPSSAPLCDIDDLVGLTELDLDGNTVIAGGEVQYATAVDDTLQCHCQLPDNWDEVTRKLTDRGKSSVHLSSEIQLAEKPAMVFEGTYVIRLNQ